MVSLADLFGDDEKQKRVRPGAVVYMDVEFTDHPKYLLIACCEPECLVFVINTEINAYFEGKPDLIACHVDLPYDDHKFMKHDSHINCVEVIRAIPLSEIIDNVVKSYSIHFKGDIKPYCARAVIEAVKKAPTISQRHKNHIIQAFDHYA